MGHDTFAVHAGAAEDGHSGTSPNEIECGKWGDWPYLTRYFCNARQYVHAGCVQLSAGADVSGTGVKDACVHLPPATLHRGQNLLAVHMQRWEDPDACMQEWSSVLETQNGNFVCAPDDRIRCLSI